MTKLRVRIPVSTISDRSHSRHLFEAMGRSPHLTQVDEGQSADVAFNEGPATLNVFRVQSDPHALSHLRPVSEMIVDWAEPAMTQAVKMVPTLSSAFLAQWLHWVRNIDEHPFPQNPFPTKGKGWDVMTAWMTDPYKRILQPASDLPFLRVPFCVPEWFFHTTLEEERPFDVFFTGAIGRFYPIRILVTNHLRSREAKDIIFRLISTTPREKTSDIPVFDKHQNWYADCLRQSKTILFCGSIINVPVQKFYESMACGCLVMAPLPKDAAINGFVDGETMVVIDHLNYLDKLRYYLKNNTERRRITRNAARLIQRNHTCSARVGLLTERLTQILDGVPAEETPDELIPW